MIYIKLFYKSFAYIFFTVIFLMASFNPGRDEYLLANYGKVKIFDIKNYENSNCRVGKVSWKACYKINVSSDSINLTYTDYEKPKGKVMIRYFPLDPKIFVIDSGRDYGWDYFKRRGVENSTFTILLLFALLTGSCAIYTYHSATKGLVEFKSLRANKTVNIINNLSSNNSLDLAKVVYNPKDFRR